KGPDDVLSKNNMGGICEDNDGRMYFMEEEGVVYYLDPEGATLKTLKLARLEDTTTTVDFRAGAELLYDPQLHALWGTAQRTNPNRGGLLFRYDIGTETTQTFQSKYALGAMCFGPDRLLYVAGSDPREIGVLLSFDRATQTFTEVAEAGNVETIRGFRINYLLAAGTGELLLGTENRGLGVYDVASKELSFYEFDETDEQQQLRRSQVIHVIHEDSLGNWWLGTESGLYCYQRSTGNITTYGRQEGLSNNIIYGIVPDSAGGFWLSTQNGLTRMMGDFQQGSFRRYYQEDGLSNDQFNPFSFHRSKKDGRYCFGGINGLTVFRESDLASSSAGADVMLTEIKVFGREKERKIANNLGALRQVTVLAHEKSIAISFALPAG
ncbi:MAG: two-component regulator propeller domain-containing protein, partial [Bacteroidota bacterium]